MVKFHIKNIKYNWDNTIQEIIAQVFLNRFIGSFTRKWTFLCGTCKRIDLKETNRKNYNSIQYQEELKEKLHPKTITIITEKTREEKRKDCKCKSKCQKEFNKRCAI